MQEVQDVLKKIKDRLTLADFEFERPLKELPPLPQPKEETEKTEEERRADVLLAIQSFNAGQKVVFNAVVSAILPGVTADDPFAPVSKEKRSIARNSNSFFLDAPVGTGKTFAIRTTQSLLELRVRKVLSVATSAVAASLLKIRRTAHTTFKIPISCDSESVCVISLEPVLAALIHDADLIIWDEIVMCLRYCIETVDRNLKQIMNNLFALFRGKCVLFSGDYRLILPVFPNASRGMIVHMCLKSSHLFNGLHVIYLTENMKLKLLKDDPNADISALQYH